MSWWKESDGPVTGSRRYDRRRMLGLGLGALAATLGLHSKDVLAGERGSGSTSGVEFMPTLSRNAQSRESGNLLSNNEQNRRDALAELQKIPLTAEGQQTVAWVLENMSVYRRMPVHRMQCDPLLYRFCVENPDIVVAIWEVLKVTQLHAERRTPDLFRIYDGGGMDGYVQMLHHSEYRHVAFVDGTYQGSFLPKVRGRGVLLLASDYRKGEDGQTLVDCRLDAFFNVEPGGAEFLTRTLMPIVGKTSDDNFEQTASFVAYLSQTAKERPAAIPWLAQQMNSIPAEVRSQFVAIAAPQSETPQTTSVARIPMETNSTMTPLPIDSPMGANVPQGAVPPSPSIPLNATADGASAGANATISTRTAATPQFLWSDPVRR